MAADVSHVICDWSIKRRADLKLAVYGDLKYASAMANIEKLVKPVSYCKNTV